MGRRRCHVPKHLAASVVAALQASGRVALSKPGDALLKGKVDGNAVTVWPDGRIEVEEHASPLALLTQCVKGVLERPRGKFIVGIDESGMAGEAENPVAAMVLLSPEVRAELIVAGVADCKVVGADRLGALAKVVAQTTIRHETIQVADAPKGDARSSKVAEAVGQALCRWHAEGWLPAGVHILMDQTDAEALARGLGDVWSEFESSISMEKGADARHVEVAAASILARVGTVPVKAKPKAGSPAPMGHFQVGDYAPSDKADVLGFLKGLVQSYPDIAKWIGTDESPKVWAKVETGDLHLSVARFDGRVVAFCLWQRKDARNGKISTFFVAPSHRRQHIGHRLLRRELERMAKAGLRRVFVTFGHEEFDNMHRFFQEHGFTVDGISPQRYRDNSYEVIMGKRFHPEPVELEDFHRFVEHGVFRMQGFDIERIDDATFLTTSRQSLLYGPMAQANRILVHTTTNPEPEATVDAVRTLGKEHAATPVLASAYGFPADQPLPPDVEVLDALRLEQMFFPMSIQRDDTKDLVIPIRPEFASRLFPEPQQTTLAVSKLALRTTNTYYRVAKNTGGMRRGDRLLFYESEGKGVTGYAHLEKIDIGTAKRLHAMHGGLGAWTVEQIAEHTSGKDGAAYRFSDYRRLKKPVGNNDIKALCSTFNPQTVYRLPRKTGTAIIDKGQP